MGRTHLTYDRYLLALTEQEVARREENRRPFSPTGAQLIFQFCSALYERVAMIVTTDLRFAERSGFL